MMASTDAIVHSHGESDTHGETPHALPVKLLVTVFLILVGLTILTVVATLFPTGSLEIWISMGIATIKASLVAAYFMHLRYDNPMNAVIFIFGLFFVALFLGFILLDSHHYQSTLFINQAGG
jgi:cytochrome c oxidase subunit IV